MQSTFWGRSPVPADQRTALPPAREGEPSLGNAPAAPADTPAPPPPSAALAVKRLPEMRETQVQSLRWENPLEKEMATHCGTLAFENSMDREAWWATLDVVAMNQKGRRDFTFTFMPR